MTPADRYDSLFKFYGEKSGVDWRLLKAQVWAESNFNPYAVSPAGAKGLAQFMPVTWGEWNKEDEIIFNPEASIKTQAKYMSWLLRSFTGDVMLALAAYNCGIGRVKKLISGDDDNYQRIAGMLPNETQNYVNKIITSEYMK